jgi:hypothetical protein
MGCTQSAAASEISGYSVEKEIFPARDIYRDLHGDSIPDTFVVPESDKWPENFQGMPLGLIVSLI